MAFRPGYGMPYQQQYPPQPQQIVFGQMRMPGHQPAPPPQKAPDPTPVFVGNISEKCTDEFIQKILNECGAVSSWKRIKGNNGKLQGFGFCNFSDLEGTLRALRILHDFHLGDKKLTVKAEEKVRSELRKTAIENRKRQGKKELKLKDGELPADEDDLKKDEEIRLKILHWMETDHKELFSFTEDGELSEEAKRAKAAEDKSDKPSSTTSANKKDDRNRRRRSRSRGGRSSRRSRSTSPRNKKYRRSRSTSGSSSSSNSTSSSRSASYSSRSRSRSPQRSKHSKRRRSASRGSEDSDEAREKRIMKQMMKEKEQAYHARLKRWESRERQMAKKYEKEERREHDRKKNTQKECKRLKTFLEDYEDERDDPKFFKSSLYFQRKRDYEKEREADQKDRIQELQEIEELKKQIMLEVENGQPTINVDEEALKRHNLKFQEEEARRKMRADSGSPNPHQPLGQSANGANGESESSDEESGSEKTSDVKIKEEIKVEQIEPPKEIAVEATTTATEVTSSDSPAPSQNGGWKAIGDSSQQTSAQIARPVASGSAALTKKEAISPIPIAQRLNGVFGNDDEEDDIHKRKKMKPFEITREERMQVMSVDEKKELTKQIIRKIPLTKDELFIHKIEWEQLDQNWMQDRVRPWVAKKISSFFGEEDNTLCDFICEQIDKRTPPEQMLKDVAMIIDDDAEQFVIKLWRLLIYEGQARRMGIT